MRTRRLVSTLLLLALTASCKPAASPFARADADPELVPVPLGGDFTLTGDDGQPFDSRSLRGRTVLLFFGYTTCPDACPTMLAKLVRVYSLLEREGVARQVRTVFVSIDPERDKPEALKKYLSYFAIPATGVTGPEADLRVMAENFGATFEKVQSTSEAGYLMNHTTHLYLLDGLGRVRHLFALDDPAEKIAAVTAKATRLACCR